MSLATFRNQSVACARCDSVFRIRLELFRLHLPWRCLLWWFKSLREHWNKSEYGSPLQFKSIILMMVLMSWEINAKSDWLCNRGLHQLGINLKYTTILSLPWVVPSGAYLVPVTREACDRNCIATGPIVWGPPEWISDVSSTNSVMASCYTGTELWGKICHIYNGLPSHG